MPRMRAILAALRPASHAGQIIPVDKSSNDIATSEQKGNATCRTVRKPDSIAHSVEQLLGASCQARFRNPSLPIERTRDTILTWYV